MTARLNFCLSLVVVMLPAFAAAQSEPPVITAVSPATGAASGGTTVTLTGRGFNPPPGFACIAPCPPLIAFGGAPVTEVKSYGDTEIIVVTPPHASGVVDVTVRTPDNRSVTVRDAFTYTGTPAAEVVLLPVNIDGKKAGAGGSTWQTDFWIRNNGNTTLTIAPVGCPPPMLCPAVFPLTRVLAPGEAMHNITPNPTSAPNIGRILYLSGASPADVSTNLRAADTSRNALDDGTEIPVVRESELLTRTTHILNVPLSGSRLLLRIYDVGLTFAQFRVRYYLMTESANVTALATHVLTATTTDSGPFRASPAYAEDSDFNFFALMTFPGPQSLRVEIEPLTPGSRYWAFASVTNNTTQHATIVTPQ